MSNPKVAEIVPFGKYKGQPVEVLAQDRNYCEWLTGQEWFRTRFTTIHTLIVNNFAEPSETPEHNALQAKFLDATWREKFVNARCGQELRRSLIQSFNRYVVCWEKACANKLQKVAEAKDAKERAEDDRYGYKAASLEQAGNEYQKCLAALSRLQQVPRDDRVVITTTDPRFEVDGSDVFFRATASLTEASPLLADLDERLEEGHWHYIECKPSLGDDYPAVLRQIRSGALRTPRFRNDTTQNLLHDYHYLFSLVIGDYTGTGATLEQVRQIFTPISVLTVADIEGGE